MSIRREEIDQRPSLIKGPEWDAIVAAVCSDEESHIVDEAIERLLAA